jgi:fused signal recognition particle receptor
MSEGENQEKKKGFFSRLAAGLRRSSSGISESVTAVFTKKKLDSQTLEALEDALIAADLGAPIALRVTQRLAKDRFDREITDEEVKTVLAETIAETLRPLEAPLDIGGGSDPEVVLFVGVNGSGKTTTLGKIAARMVRDGQSPLLVAGDTFRAAAVEQIAVWGERAGAPVERREIGADAAGLAFDAVQRARREHLDAVLIDTAGRLQNRTELMDELRKIVRVLGKMDETAPHKVILVLDGTVGSNAMSQAAAFLEAARVTGLIMTKLDGTAKGGALVQVAEKFALPIHAIGIGEGIDDLQPFDARAFARALAGLDEA